jgi:sn-glycerol 3-phosphate transport system substrate-binding protein
MKKPFLAIATLAATVTVAALAQTTRTTVDFWYALGGSIGEQIEAQVKDFNSSQTAVTVRAQYVGNYDDGINKFRAALQAGRGIPHVVQVYDIGTRFMSDSDAIVPLQDVAARDNYDLSRFVGAPRNYYTVDGKLNSLPYNSSNPLLYFNAAMLQQAGISFDPTWSLSDLEAVVKKLTVKDASGKTTRFGLTIPIDSWYIEQFSYNSGEFFCNNENGRKARATSTSIDNPAAVAFVDWWGRMVREGFVANTGRAGADSQNLFANGQAAIGVYSTASLFGVTKLVNNKFPIRTAYYPYLKTRNGVAIGGASLWLTKGNPQNEQDAAWRFIKYLLEPKSQATWHLGTGYFPVVGGVLGRPEVTQAHIKNPNFTTAIKQLESSKVNTYSAGCLMGAFTEIRPFVQSAIEEVIKGRPAAEAMRDAKTKADAALARYNASVGK